MAKITVRYVGKKQSTATRVKAIVRLLIFFVSIQTNIPFKTIFIYYNHSKSLSSSAIPSIWEASLWTRACGASTRIPIIKWVLSFFLLQYSFCVVFLQSHAIQYLTPSAQCNANRCGREEEDAEKTSQCKKHH